MKQLRYVVSLAVIGAALTIVPAVQQAAVGDSPPAAAREPALVQKIRDGARGSVKASASRATGKASFVRAGRNGDLFPASKAGPKAKADAFLRAYAPAFGAPYGQLVRSDVYQDNLGATTVTYHQRYQGISVFGATLRVHVDAQGDLTAVNGQLVPVGDLSLVKTVDAKAAAAKALAAVRRDPPGAEDGAKVDLSGLKTNTSLVVYRHGLIQGVADGRTELAYQVEVTNGDNIRDMVYVSANGGKVVNRYSLIDNALHRILYEASLKPNGTIKFSEVWEEGKKFPGKLNVDQQNMVESTGEAYWLFHNAFSRDSWDGAGAQMITVNNDPRIACPNANWNGVTTNYCDGVSSDDVVAHEWGHAYTEGTSHLIYQWQPGAMNEAFSDIWGETVDLINGRQDDDEGDISAPRTEGLCSMHSNPNPQVVINSPAGIAKICVAGDASFGPKVTAAGLTGDIVLGTDVAEPADAGTQTPAGTTTDGCSSLDNAADIAGNIALLDRGRCDFVLKAKNAQDAGAVGVVIANTLGRGAFGMAGTDPTITIPAVGISNADGDRIKSAFPGTVNVTLRDGTTETEVDEYRWLMGEDSAAFGGAIRDMWQPTCLGMPGKVSDAEYVCDTEDSGGVHTNSGVVNHGYALLVDGGSYNGVDVEGIGLDKAANIYWRAQSVYLTEFDGFPQLADALEMSCADLIDAPINELSTAANDSNPATDLIDAADCAQVTKAIQAVELRADPTEQCGWVPQYDADTPSLCGEGFTSTTVFSEDFEDGLDGWTLTDNSVYGGPAPTWTTTTDLFGDHSGQAVKGPAPDRGQCDASTGDLSGTSFLTSGDIAIPADGEAPRLQFSHYVATEFDVDGGNVQLSVNGGGFAPIPAAAYTFNAPRPLLTAGAGNTNPLAGQDAFSGTDGGTVRGSWVESQVDLTEAGVAPGDTIALRLAMGRDGCGGNDGWYVDDVEVVTCTESDTPTPTEPTTGTTSPTTGPTDPTTGPTTGPTSDTKVATVTKVRKPKKAPKFKADFRVRVRVVASGLTPTGRVLIKHKGVVIAKGRLVDGKVRLLVKKNLAVGRQKLVARYKGSSTALPSRKVFYIRIVR